MNSSETQGPLIPPHCFVVLVDGVIEGGAPSKCTFPKAIIHTIDKILLP